MKATYVQKGENINYKNPTEDKITLGTLIIIAAICAVAAVDIEPGEIGTVATTGSWNIPKDNTAIEIGEKVYYDSENDVATKTAKDNVIGYAIESADAESSTVKVKLNG